MKKAEIKINVTLNEHNIPEKLSWSSSDNQNKQESCKAVMMSLWDSKNKTTSRIDLWTKDMPINEMKFFFYQSLVTMKETYLRATNDEEVKALMCNFEKKLKKLIID